MKSLDLPRHTPASFAAFWSRDRGRLRELLVELQPDYILEEADVAVFWSQPGDPAIHEAAVNFSQHLLRRAGDHELRCLIFPSRAIRRGGAVEVDDLLIQDLVAAPPPLAPGQVHLTGYAVRGLETAWETTRRGSYAGPSGLTRSLWTLDKPARDAAPWRNPKVLRRRMAAVDRECFAALRSKLAAPVIRVVGPLGVGKTRALAEALSRRSPHVWAQAWSARAGGPAIAKQLGDALAGLDSAPRLRRREMHSDWWSSDDGLHAEDFIADVCQALTTSKLEQPVTLVLDDLHAAWGSDRELVGRLLAHPRLGHTFRLALVGRPSSWIDDWNLPSIDIAGLAPGPAEMYWHQLSDGLSMPSTVREKFAEVCGGHPMALEEGLFQLIRDRFLRQLYGNFFFSGPSELEYVPTPRLVRHVEAEAQRIRAGAVPAVVALSESAVTVRQLEALEQSLAAPLSETLRSLSASGLLEQHASSWGPGVRFRYQAFRLCVRRGLAPEAAESVRRLLQSPPSEEATNAQLAWRNYQQVAGTKSAPEMLLQAAAHLEELDARALFDAFRSELGTTRSAPLERQQEFDLLWSFLPMARRLGQLRNLEPAIHRAQELAGDDSSKRIALLSLHADHALAAGELRKASQQVEVALKLVQGADLRRQSILLFQLGRLLQRQGRYDEAWQLFSDLTERIDHEAHEPILATCRYHLGNIYLAQNRLVEAAQLHREALEIRKRLDLRLPRGQSMTSLARTLLALGAFAEALELFEQARPLLREHGGPAEETFALFGLAQVWRRLGRAAMAEPLLRQSVALRENTDDQLGEAVARLALAENALDLGEVDRAEREARKASFKLALIDAPQTLGDAEFTLGNILLAQRHTQEAFESFRSALGRHGSGHPQAPHDQSGLLKAAMALDDVEEVSRLTYSLEARLRERYPENGELIDLTLAQACRWLQKRNLDGPAASLPARRGYERLTRQGENLSAEDRAHFFSLPSYQALSAEAARPSPVKR